MSECPKCGFDAPGGDAECPRCGIVFEKFEARKNKTRDATPVKPLESESAGEKIRVFTFLGIMICFLAFFAWNNFRPEKSPPPKPPKSAKEIRAERIARQFSGWDGSHINLTERIKKTMNDPDSFKHEETRYWDKGDFLIVETVFRGRNAFGGMVRNRVMAKVGLNGRVLEIMYQGK